MVDVQGLVTDLANKHGVDHRDIQWYAWPQMFGSTAGPGSGVGGRAMTTFQVVAFELPDGQMLKFCAGHWKRWNGQIMEKDKMSSIYNFIEADQRGKFSAFVVLEAVTNIGAEKFNNPETGYIDSENMEVELKINGIEVDFEYVMGLVDDQLEKYKREVYEEQKRGVTIDIEHEIMRVLGQYRGDEEW